MSDKTAKLALVISLITLVLVVGGVLTTYFIARNLVVTQVDNVVNVLQDLKVRKFSIPIYVDRVVEFPINTSIPINYSRVVEFPLNESLSIPVSMSIPIELPISTPLEIPVNTSLVINYSTISKSSIVLGDTVHELEIPINISTEVPTTLTVKTLINYTAKTVININTTLPITISKTVKIPLNESLEIPIKQVFRVPIKLDITYEFTLKDLGLDKLVDQLITTLSEVKKKL